MVRINIDLVDCLDNNAQNQARTMIQTFASLPWLHDSVVEWTIYSVDSKSSTQTDCLKAICKIVKTTKGNFVLIFNSCNPLNKNLLNVKTGVVYNLAHLKSIRIKHKNTVFTDSCNKNCAPCMEAVSICQLEGNVFTRWFCAFCLPKGWCMGLQRRLYLNLRVHVQRNFVFQGRLPCPSPKIHSIMHVQAHARRDALCNLQYCGQLSSKFSFWQSYSFYIIRQMKSFFREHHVQWMYI